MIVCNSPTIKADQEIQKRREVGGGGLDPANLGKRWGWGVSELQKTSFAV